MRLLVTRPETDAERTALALEKLGHEVLISPALEIRYRIDVPIKSRNPQAVLATSVNAIRALERHGQRKMLLRCPVLAVGDRTALEAKRAGFAGARSAEGSVDDLYNLVLQQCTPAAGPLLYAVGADQAGDLAGRLGDAGYAVETIRAYGAEPSPGLTVAAQQNLQAGSIDGVLFYSARSARSFGNQLKHAGLPPLAAPITCYCLSETIADQVRTFTSGPVRIADKPDQLALFGQLAD